MLTRVPPTRQRGTSMMEVLVAIVIVIIGLLGLAGLQARINLAEMEAFQRAQAVVLLQDMVDRINANRKNSMTYVTATPMGTGNAVIDCTAKVGMDLDMCEWNNALLGAAETAGGNQVGAMIGAQGCVQNLAAAMPRRFLVSVVWQGLNPTVSPTAVTTCGQGNFTPDTTRRAIVANVVIGCLQNDPASGACVTP